MPGRRSAPQSRQRRQFVYTIGYRILQISEVTKEADLKGCCRPCARRCPESEDLMRTAVRPTCARSFRAPPFEISIQIREKRMSPRRALRRSLLPLSPKRTQVRLKSLL